MNNNQKIAENIREQYVEKKKNKIDELVALDWKVKRPAEIFAYSFGVVGSLVLGTGMCLAMKVIGNMMPLGVVIGLLGIGMVAVNYSIYKFIVEKQKKKYGKKILALSDEILNS